MKVLDFGLARAPGPVSENTATQTEAQPAAMVEGT